MCRRTAIRGLGVVLVLFVALWLIGKFLPPAPSSPVKSGATAVPPTPALPAPTVAPTITVIPPTLDAAGRAIMATQAWFVQQQTQAAAGQPVQFVPTAQPQQANGGTTFDQAGYIQAISDSISILAGGRNILSVQVFDGRENGGQRIAWIRYLSTESTQAGYVDEWVDLFEAAAVGIKNHSLDIDRVGLILGTGDMASSTIVSAATADLLAYQNNQIDRAAFLSKLGNRWAVKLCEEDDLDGHDEAEWDAQFAASQNVLNMLAEEAHADYEAGLTDDLDEVELEDDEDQ